jgi:hypothetical protein
MEYFKNDTNIKIQGKCPYCKQKVFLDSSHSVDIAQKGQVTFDRTSKRTTLNIYGIRICPDPKCNKVIFFEATSFVEEDKITNLRLYPKIFSASVNSCIPELVAKSYEDALACYEYDLYTPAAIMIRKTIENICEDKGATGPNLHQRIHDLRSKITISNELYDAIMELKFLGNDAAHVEAKDFNSIDQENLKLAMLFITEILRNLYLFKDQLEAFRSLKKQQEKE